MHARGNYVLSMEGGNFHSNVYCSADCGIYFWTVCQTKEDCEKTRLSTCLLFSVFRKANDWCSY